jgi:translation initiation factor IF-2
MQGALKISIAVMVVVGAVPAAASAQVLDVPPVRVPSVSVPPVTLPAPLPQVSTPQVSTPPVTVPGVRVDAPLPSAPPVPPVPQVQAPPPPSPRPAVPVVDSAPSTNPSGTTAGSSGQTPSGTVAAAGTPSASPARGGRVAQAAAVSGGRGVLGTTYRSRGRLVRALRSCIGALPARQDRLLILRYGVAGSAPRSGREVAGLLDLSGSKYRQLWGRALRGLVRAARAGGCLGGGARGDAPPAGPGSAGVGPAPVAADPGPARAELGVLGERASGAEDPAGPERSGLSTPLALDAEASDGSVLGALLLVAALAVLSVLGLRAVSARVSGRGGPTEDAG